MQFSSHLWLENGIHNRLLKSSQKKKDLNDVTAALFLVGFFAAGSWEKDTENEAAVTSLRSFLFGDNKNWKFHNLLSIYSKIPLQIV